MALENSSDIFKENGIEINKLLRIVSFKNENFNQSTIEAYLAKGNFGEINFTILKFKSENRININVIDFLSLNNNLNILKFIKNIDDNINKISYSIFDYGVLF